MALLHVPFRERLKLRNINSHFLHISQEGTIGEILRVQERRSYVALALGGQAIASSHSLNV